MGERVPIKTWCHDIEDSAVAQVYNLAKLPFVFSHVALMPDCHAGYGMPIGGVIACDGVVVPNAVGVDIGCGMRARRLPIAHNDVDEKWLKDALGKIREAIPVGFSHHKDPADFPASLRDAPEDIPVLRSELTKAKYQLGTLGGGNHFIELQAGSDGLLWLMIHSGSRNFGYKIAKEYNRIAQDLCHKWFSNIPPFKGEDGLAFLPEDSREGQDYIRAMSFALSFARENRRQMMSVASNILSPEIDGGAEYDCHHNYATKENHFGRNVWVHRKGAVEARAGSLCLIPGSQGSSSYVGIGLGNPDSFCSCSHGAGRAMGRNEARRTLNLADEQEKMKGIIHSVRNEQDLDESVSAYKDIDAVMEAQSDLVKIETKLRPLAVVKG
jgi:tRNA-splicing ligase RtcB